MQLPFIFPDAHLPLDCDDFSFKKLKDLILLVYALDIYHPTIVLL